MTDYPPISYLGGLLSLQEEARKLDEERATEQHKLNSLQEKIGPAIAKLNEFTRYVTVWLIVVQEVTYHMNIPYPQQSGH